MEIASRKGESLLASIIISEGKPAAFSFKGSQYGKPNSRALLSPDFAEITN